MSTQVFLTAISIPFWTALLIFGMKYYATTQQAKARLSEDHAYRQIAERAVAAESNHATVLSSIQATLNDVRTRLTAIEKVLKEVE